MSIWFYLYVISEIAYIMWHFISKIYMQYLYTYMYVCCTVLFCFGTLIHLVKESKHIYTWVRNKFDNHNIYVYIPGLAFLWSIILYSHLCDNILLVSLFYCLYIYIYPYIYTLLFMYFYVYILVLVFGVIEKLHL